MATIKETHRATVKNRNDPQKRGRIEVACASLMGVDANGEAVDYPGFIEPLFSVLFSDNNDRVNAGFFAVPSVGATVEIEISKSSSYDQVPGQTEQTDPDPRWKACVLRAGDIIAPEFLVNYPDRLGYVTASGHVLIFDDSANGDVTLSHRGGMQLSLKASGIKLGLSTPAGPDGVISIDLLALFDQLLTALDVFTKATTVAVIEPTLGASSLALQLQVQIIKKLLAQIKA